VFVDEDGARARALAGPHLRYQQDQYHRWFAAAGDRATVAVDPDALPPGCLVGTPEEVVASIRAARQRVPFTDFSFWMLAPGMDPAVATASLELFAERVLPAIATL
jgi:alkanesulfonate monooxygenase SsuD/methylene tetrahydromethanopterin reductase-like flavin-dependent oxidoreductase (luciferase family)